MPENGDLGSREVHQTVVGGERVLIRRARPEDVALYRDFLAGVSAEDLRLRFFADVGELSAEETISTTATKWLSSRSTKTRGRCWGSCA